MSISRIFVHRSSLKFVVKHFRISILIQEVKELILLPLGHRRTYVDLNLIYRLPNCRGEYPLFLGFVTLFRSVSLVVLLVGCVYNVDCSDTSKMPSLFNNYIVIFVWKYWNSNLSIFHVENNFFSTVVEKNGGSDIRF
ncbi:unnamed protein product [Ixodes pacificus]